jgi:hypothetical protein
MTISNRFGLPQRTRHVAVFSFGPGTAPQLRQPIDTSLGRAAGVARQRARIWELSNTFHCSVIGTCLTTAEVRGLLAKLALADVAALSEHQIHAHGVHLAAKGDFSGKLLNKTLDKKHRRDIARFAEVKSADGVRELWAAALQAGDIPGAYWAAMTHPAATDEVLRAVFEDVHMLSHLVGAANRADIRRLRALEAENASLTGKVSRQQAQLREAVASRDKVIAELQRLLAASPAATGGSASEAQASPAGEPAEGDVHLLERWAKLARRCEALERRLGAMADQLGEERARRRAAEVRDAGLKAEIAALEAALDAASADTAAEAPLPRVDATVLYVGGRLHLMAKLRAAAEAMGITLLHHDGGEECSSRLIGPLIGRADVVLFPVDCVSHDAMGHIKKACRLLGKPYRALRSSGLASFLAAAREIAGNEAAGTGTAPSPMPR